MTSTTPRGNQPTGARAIINGTISNGATWAEAFEIQENESFVTDADTWDWQLNLRTSYDTAVDLALTTDAGTITVVNGASSTTFTIMVPYTDLSALEGDYIIDIASRDADGIVIHWAHGSVTVRNEPIWI